MKKRLKKRTKTRLKRRARKRVKKRVEMGNKNKKNPRIQLKKPAAKREKNRILRTQQKMGLIKMGKKQKRIVLQMRLQLRAETKRMTLKEVPLLLVSLFKPFIVCIYILYCLYLYPLLSVFISFIACIYSVMP